MSSKYDRRTIVGAGLGCAGALLTGGYAWDQYAERHHLRFRPLEAINESDEAVSLEVTVGTDLAGDERTVALAPRNDEGGAYRDHVAGPWLKSGREWAVRAEFEGQRLELDAAEITDRLEGAGWGTDCARVSIVVTEDRTLESRVAPSDVC